MNAIAIKNWFKRDTGGGSVSRKISNIGLEISLSSLNMVQLEQNPDGRILIRDWATEPLPIDRKDFIFDKVAVKESVKAARSTASFKGRKINAMLPASELKIISVTHENVGGESRDHAVAEALSSRLDGDISDYVVDYLPIRQKNESKRGLAIVAFARLEKVEAYLEVLSSAGLQPGALDIGPAAIKRLVVALRNPQANETVMVINFGAKLSYLSILSGRRLLFDEEVKFGEDLLIDEVSSALQMDRAMARQQIIETGMISSETASNPVEREIADTMRQIVKPQFNTLADSIKRALIYAVAETRGEPVNHVYVLGSIARYRGVDRMLQSLIELPVSVLPDPLSHFPSTLSDAQAANRGKQPELALATGLALRDLQLNV